MTTLPLEPLEAMERRFEDLEAEMAKPEVAADYPRLSSLARQRASMEGVIEQFRQYRKALNELEEAQDVLSSSKDEDLKELATSEVESLQSTITGIEDALRLALLPKDPRDDRDVFVEIRAGTGGDEAGLFAGDLFRMYGRYAQQRGWNVEVLNSSETEIGGFKEITFNVKGTGVYKWLKHESGVHRVQRVPETEASGRIHTSTATVAVLPEADEVEVEINPSDVRIDVFHAGGAGGQNVNKVATAIRLTHFPTGLVVTCQDERSQLQNRTKAFAILRARLLENEIQRQEKETAATRKSQVGTGERSEKIRTYNFPQNRVTDHRINLTVHSLDRVLEGAVESLLDALMQAEQERLLAESVA